MDWLDCEPAHEICKSLGGDGGAESLHWLPIDELLDYHLYPDFVKHFITKNGKTLPAHKD